ncbi:putative asparagine--tRNA ligase [Helianthus anomalus]
MVSCEGAGEQFCLTTLIPSSKEAIDSVVNAIQRTKNGLIDWSQVRVSFYFLCFSHI